MVDFSVEIEFPFEWDFHASWLTNTLNSWDSDSHNPNCKKNLSCLRVSYGERLFDCTNFQDQMVHYTVFRDNYCADCCRRLAYLEHNTLYCEYCGRKYLIDDLESFKKWASASCNSCGKKLTDWSDYGPDPFVNEMYGDDSPCWLCSDCACQRAGDI